VTAALTTSGLGRRFGSRWAVQDCTLSIPEGRVCGLVGANGAGKTTLLRMLAGLSTPTTGDLEVCGRRPGDDVAFLSDVGFLAQEIPLHKRWNAEDHLRFGAAMNPRWDDAVARERLHALQIPFEQPIRTLSGGQRAQVALALCLGKRPRVLLLDEPVAALDPLARREFLSTLASAVADGDLTVVLSSHLVTDLERICDYLVVLAASQTMLAADIEDVLATHRILTSPRRDTSAIERDHVVLQRESTQRQTSLWVRLNGPVHDPAWQVDELGLEDIVLAYLGSQHPLERSPQLGTVAS
jgi:ABC-2 type transport system ATP-binding protein